MNISEQQLKKIIKAVYQTLVEGRIYKGGDERQDQISTEYELTPDEITALKGMSRVERMRFAGKKIKQARRAKGQCISGGPNCEPPPKDASGQPGPYCAKHLQGFRDARVRLAQKRGSCVRCPNPPLPGKKLCQNCTDELQARRNKAIEQGICVRCFEKPAEPGMQVCRTCAKIKAGTERVRRETNPEVEKERIKKRDAEYRKAHGTDAKRNQAYRRQKDRAAKIGWEIEENNLLSEQNEDENQKRFRRQKEILQIKKLLKQEDLEVLLERLQDADGLVTFGVFDTIHSPSVEFVQNRIQTLILPFTKNGVVIVRPSDQPSVYTVAFWLV